MCASNVYLVNDKGGMDLVMEQVDIVRPEGAKVYLRTVAGKEKRLAGRIRELRLEDHAIIIEKPS